MIVKPMVRNNICMNAHPEGCRIHVLKQIDYIKGKKRFSGPKNMLVIGGSAGYGLATRIAAAFGAGTGTLSVAFEKPASDKRGATVGWYNTEVFQKEALAAGLEAESLYGDAFSNEMKAETVARIKALFGKVDLVVYSLASGLRVDPATGTMYKSVLKPVGSTYHARALNPMTGELTEADIAPAVQEELDATVKVMGGEDWALWIDALLDAGVLAEGARTLAYSYIGPEYTRAIYRDGTIGKAKEHLEHTAHVLRDRLSAIGGEAYVSINKALVTRASAVIPAVPLYLTILFKIMKKKGLHEGCIEQMYRLFTERLSVKPVPTDPEGRIRLDDWEMRKDVQDEVAAVWDEVEASTLGSYADLEQYRKDFLNLHGFGYDEIDYDKDVEV